MPVQVPVKRDCVEVLDRRREPGCTAPDPTDPVLPFPGRLVAGIGGPGAGKIRWVAEFTFAPLTPASFLDRSAAVFADRAAIIDGERRFTYREMSDRCGRLMAALAARGVARVTRRRGRSPAAAAS